MLTKDKLEKISDLSFLFKFTIQFVVFVGVCVSLRYFVDIKYYPQGLTIGDTLFFIASSIAFATVYFVFVAVLLCGGITLSPLFIVIYNIKTFVLPKRGKSPKRAIRLPISTGKLSLFAFPGSFVFYWIANLYKTDFSKAFEIVLITLVMGILFCVFNSKPVLKRYDQRKIVFKKSMIIVMIILMPLIMFKENDIILKKTMELIGVRADSTVIVLDKKHVDFFKALGKEPEKFISNGNAVYKDITILFRGIGSNVVIDLDVGNVVIPEKDLVVASKN